MSELSDRIDKMARSEILLAMEADQAGKPFPPFELISSILMEGELGWLSKETLEGLGLFLAAPLRKGKKIKSKGRPTTRTSDIQLFMEHRQLITEMTSEKAHEILKDKRGHLDVRSTRRAVARGKNACIEEWIKEQRNITTNALALRTDKK